jgi:hypothetical protein
VADDIGAKITVRVTGNAFEGVEQFPYLSASAKSSTSIKTGGPTLTNTMPPSISGTDTVGQTLTADPGVWTEGTPNFAYQWLVAGKAVTGATKSTFVIPASAYSTAGKSITVTVTALETGFSATPLTSDPTPTIAGKLFAADGDVTYTGTAEVGATLKAILPTYSPKPTAITYAWSLGGHVVSTKSSYKIPASASGQTISLLVTASKSGYANSVLIIDSIPVADLIP